MYCIDTSALLDGWTRYYPPDVFPVLWERLEQLIAEGRLITTEEVLIELEKKDDEVHAWAREHREMFQPIDEDTQVAIVELLDRYERLVNTQKNRSMADPWVVALAQTRKCVVVSGEKRSGNLARPKIPDVCDALGIAAIDLLEMIRKEGWRF